MRRVATEKVIFRQRVGGDEGGASYVDPSGRGRGR